MTVLSKENKTAYTIDLNQLINLLQSAEKEVSKLKRKLCPSIDFCTWFILISLSFFNIFNALSILNIETFNNLSK